MEATHARSIEGLLLSRVVDGIDVASEGSWYAGMMVEFRVEGAGTCGS